jgi:membrane-associated HD superfamily phosphohydrolase
VPNSEKTHKLPDADKQLKWFRRLQTLYHFRPEPVKWVLYLMVSLLVVMLIFYPREYLAGKKYQVGEVAMKTIKVMRDSEVQDRVTTAQQRSAAEDQARDVYDFDPALSESINQSLADMFAKMSKDLSVPSQAQRRVHHHARCLQGGDQTGTARPGDQRGGVGPAG